MHWLFGNFRSLLDGNLACFYLKGLAGLLVVQDFMLAAYAFSMGMCCKMLCRSCSHANSRRLRPGSEVESRKSPELAALKATILEISQLQAISV